MIIQELSRYAAEQSRTGLTPEVSHAAKRALVDWFAALFPGTQVEPTPSLLQAHAHELGCGKASLPGLHTTAQPAVAAWINGSVSHAAEFDDIFRDAIYHPGCPTIAAALAVAEHHQSSGKKLLEAITIGYEISTRIGAAVQPSHYRYFHTTGTVGCFGGAAAAAALISERADVIAHALATSASFASGLQQAFRSDAMTKALHAGHGAWVGVTSAFGANCGLTGVLDILEGSAGFGAALAHDPEWKRATDGLGTRYNIKNVTVKNHGCCGHTFASIDALLTLREKYGLNMNEIERIDVHTYKVAIEVAGIPQPVSPFEGKFSLPYVLSHACKYASVRLAAFEPDRMNEADIRTLMARIFLHEDPELTAKFPNMRAARLQIRLKNGTVLEHFQPFRIGDPEAPLGDDQISDKFMELAGPVISDSKAKKLLQRLWSIEDLDNMQELSLASL